MLNPTRLYPTLNIFAKFRQGHPLWGSWIQINCAVFWQIRCYIRRIAADTTDISSLSKTLSWKFCKWMQQLHTRAAGEWTPSPVSNIFLLLKNNPCHKTFPVTFMLAALVTATGVPCFFRREKISSPCENITSKFAVLTLCTLLMRGLLAIAKLLVKFRHPFYPSNEQS